MIGEKLKELRKKNNKTQEEVGKYLHVSYTTYGDYERDKTEPDISTIKKIAEYFNVSVDELLMAKKTDGKEVIFTKEEVDKLIEVINMLNNKLK